MNLLSDKRKKNHFKTVFPKIAFSFSVSLLLFFLTFSSSIQAYGKKAKKQKKRVSTITFEDELIQGEVQNPDLLYFSKEESSQYKKILPLRTEFLREMKETGDKLPINRKNGR